MKDKVSLHHKIRTAAVNSPRWVGRINDSLNMYALKAQADFSPWHTHADTDDVFIVLSGKITIQLRDRDIVLGPGDFYVIPTGVEHCPRAEEDSEVLLICGGNPPPPGWTDPD